MRSASRHLTVVVAAAAAITLFGTAARTQVAPASGAWPAAAPTGRLRVGVYPGSPTSMLRAPASPDPKGLAFELGREFARRLNVPFEPVEFPQIANVLEALKQGQVDFTVTNASPARARDVDFTPPILGVELGYLVPAGSSVAAHADVDRPGIRVGVTAGGSSHAALTRALTQAAVVPAQTLAIALEMLSARTVDAYATNKAILFELSDQIPGSRVLDGRWGVEEFAVAVPKGRPEALAAARRFAEDAKATGLVKQIADRAGLRGTVE